MQRLPDGSFRDQFGEQQLAATVLCRACNNDWVSALDREASAVLKPIVQNAHEVALDSGDQAAVAAWALKTVLVNDLTITRGASELVRCAPEFKASGVAPSYIEVWAGPPSLALDGDFRCIGVMPEHAHQLGLHGVIATAATGLGETLALFDEQLPGAEQPTLVDSVIWTHLPADPRRLRLAQDEIA